MERCPECKKVVWPWQKCFPSVPLVHADCDHPKFKKSCEQLSRINPDRFDRLWVLEQVSKREKLYY